MPKFRLTLLGGFRLDDEDGREMAVASRKAQGMLAVLAAHSPAAVTRERIAAIFWGDLAEERARHSLRQVLTALRRDAPIVEAGGETLRLDTRVCSSDLAEFAALAVSTDGAELAQALTLHGGPLVDGLATKEEAFEDWLCAERTRLAKVAADAMMRLAAHHAGKMEHENAVRLLRRLLADDPVNEGAQRALMRALDALGRRSEALSQYKLCGSVAEGTVDRTRRRNAGAARGHASGQRHVARRRRPRATGPCRPAVCQCRARARTRVACRVDGR
ncbi:MAG TPA: BTAD domain-containing putative transcriptional regulator [Accumulibacter sp.]|nr:BTAD domain-containing putative transcriptional regulator [Accumulibacter sp.]